MVSLSISNILSASIIALATTALFQPALATSHPKNLEGLNQLTSLSHRRGLVVTPRDAPSRINGGCADGEVAVGRWKVCSPAPGGICNPGGCAGTDGGCQAELGGVWEKNCGGAELTATIMTESYCRGGWNGGAVFGGEIGVRCGAGDRVDAVTVEGADGKTDVWAKCYKPDQGECEWTIGIASKYATISWCCPVNL